MNMKIFPPLLSVLLCTTLPAQTHQSPREAEFYPITEIEMPAGEVIEPGALELLPDDVVAVGTRRGEVWLVEGALASPPQPRWSRFAEGLHEILGLAWKDGWLYVTHRPEICRLQDSDGDGRADRFETVCDGWGISGDYHEYTFGSRFDREGNLWTVLCLTGSYSSAAPFRGWALRVSPEGELIPTASGVRSPGGIGENSLGDMFYTDNQGPWNGSSNLKWIKPGSFLGHPDGNRWYEQAPGLSAPAAPKSKSRWHVERERIPELVPPACFLPHGRLGQSSSGIACDESRGGFGPFGGQLFVGDQCYSNIARVDLEKVNGVYQGAAFPFRWGFQAGCVPLRMTPGGQLLYGGTARGWGSRGGRDFSLERVDWSGRVPFAIRTMRVIPQGFELTFTRPADAATLADPASWASHAFTYIYQGDYGSPEVDKSEPPIARIESSADGLTARVHLPLIRGHIHQLVLGGVRDAAGEPLLHDVAYYTLNEIPGAAP